MSTCKFMPEAYDSEIYRKKYLNELNIHENKVRRSMNKDIYSVRNHVKQT